MITKLGYYYMAAAAATQPQAQHWNAGQMAGAGMMGLGAVAAAPYVLDAGFNQGIDSGAADMAANKLSKLQSHQGKGVFGKAMRFVGRNPKLSMIGGGLGLGLGGLAMYKKFSSNNKTQNNIGYNI